MKSSPNAIYGARGRVIPKSWSPGVLTQEAEDSAAEAARRVEYLLGLFKPAGAVMPGKELPNISIQDTTTTSSCLLAAMKSSIQEWAPVELTSFTQETETPASPAFQSAEALMESATPEEPAPTPEELSSEKKEIETLRLEAERILNEAKAQAASILQEAQAKAEDVLMQAHREGWAAAEEETKPIIQTAKAIVEQVAGWREEVLTQSEPLVLGLVKEIAQLLFGQGYALDSESLQQAFSHTLESARTLGELKIYVNPEDATGLGPYWREFQISVSGQQIQIIPTESISRGGCFVDGDYGSVDARIETQFKAIMDTLNEGVSQQGEEE